MSMKLLIFSLAIAFVFLSAVLQKFIPHPKPKIVGIDLGTTHSSVGIFRNGVGGVEIIKDSKNRSLLPSVVAFTEREGILLGYEALAQQELNPKNTIFDAKRLIGKTFDHPDVQRDLRLYPFVVEEKDSLLSIHANGRHYVPEEISSLILRELKLRAENAVGAQIKEAVLAVPVEFTSAQRNATMRAAQLAGLKVLRMISEPTAAAIAYGLANRKESCQIIVFDFGGGTLDVSLLFLETNVFEVMSVSGDEHLGGEDFNHVMISHYTNLIKQKFDFDVQTDKILMMELRNQIERMKIELSSQEETVLHFPIKTSSDEKVYLDDVLTRDRFEEMCSSLFERMIAPVKDVLQAADVQPNEIEDVVLVGGTTRIPQVRKALEKFFGFAPNSSIDPDIAVTIGVALQAGILSDSWPVPVAAVEKPFKHISS